MAIRIRSKRNGFRRCGVAHSAEPIDWPDNSWTDEQIKALEAEPMLTVERIPDAPPEDEKPVHTEEKSPADPPPQEEPSAPKTGGRKKGKK